MLVHSFGKTKIDFNFTALHRPIFQFFLNIRLPTSLKDLVTTSIRKLKNQVMKKIRLNFQNEDLQAGLVISGFFIVVALLALFFY